MDQVKKSDIPPKVNEGGLWYYVFGADAYIKSDDAFMAYCHFSPQYDMEAVCCREREVFYVVETKDAIVTYGGTPETMEHQLELQRGMVLRMHEGEWYRFDFADPEGFVEGIVFFARQAQME